MPPRRPFRAIETAWHVLPAVFAVVTLFAAPATAEEAPADRLQEIEESLERDRERAEALARAAAERHAEYEAARQDSIAVAETIQNLEREIADSERLLAVLGVERSRREAALARERQRLGTVLAALQRLARRPAAAIVATPGEPLESLRGALLLGRTVPALETRAAQLRDQLAGVERLRTRIDEQHAVLGQRAQTLVTERARLDALALRKRELAQAAEGEHAETQERLEALAREAVDLRDLLERLEAEAKREEERREREARAAAEAMARATTLREQSDRAGPTGETTQPAGETVAAAENTPSRAPDPATAPARQQQAALPGARAQRPAEVRAFSEARGSLLLPVQGRLTRRFGEAPPSAGADTSRGLVVETAPGAQVVAPFDGLIVYAGPFRRYGLILIIEHDGRYHSLLAGMDRLTANVGQWVLAGEPVGSMADRREPAPELYLELRRSGQPVDPLPWLATIDDKARG